MAYTTIDDPSKHFQTHLWTGDGNDDRNITFDGNSDMQPDLFVFNRRPVAASVSWVDSTRGVTAELFPGSSDAETTVTNRFQAFQSDGFQAGTNNDINATSNNTYISWAWKANGGTTTTNDASATSVGSIDSVYQANTTAGFSIVTYTGAGGNQTIAHGLGAVPTVIFIKRRDDAGDWTIYTATQGNEKFLRFNANNALGDQATYFNDTTPTSTVFTVGSAGDVNTSSGTHVAYCWKDIQGFSKFGKYQGNDDADGPFVYLGFRPEFLLIKKTSTTANWISKTGKVKENNVHTEITYWDISNAENTAQDMDLLSNGFKHRSAEGDGNDDETYQYFAWARHPMLSSKGVPATAV
tara:strand:- start:45 stop:1103 length:1059 start_codon:yes stop_codon:yes gene_type:complete